VVGTSARRVRWRLVLRRCLALVVTWLVVLFGEAPVCRCCSVVASLRISGVCCSHSWRCIGRRPLLLCNRYVSQDISLKMKGDSYHNIAEINFRSWSTRSLYQKTHINLLSFKKKCAVQLRIPCVHVKFYEKTIFYQAGRVKQKLVFREMLSSAYSTSR
jgi:hypothetical protein